MNLAFMPARLIGRWRSDIAESVATDLVRFAAGPRWAMPVMVALAVVYPLAASIIHAVGPSTPGGDSLALALRPLFDVTFAESLPFMIATVGIGLVSPGLGVLFMLVFIPTDLMAAAYSNVELASKTFDGPWPGAWFARPASWLLLWVLAVEIPVRIRRFAIGWAFRQDREPPVMVTAVVQGGVTVVLVAAWAAIVPWLIKPLYTWTMLQIVQHWVTDPTWYYWWILVIGATVLAGLAVVFPSSLTTAAAAAMGDRQPDGTPRSAVAAALRQLVTVALLALLLIGLMTTVAEGAVIVLGLVLAGPVLTLTMPRIKVPALFARASTSARWLIAAIVALGLSLVIFLLAGPDKFATDYLVLAVDLAIVAPLMRIILEAGETEELELGSATPASPPPAMITSALLALALALWLGLPAVALADDCSDTSGGELTSCAGAGAGAAAGAAAAGAAAAAAALNRKKKPKPKGNELPPGWPEQKPPPGSESEPDPDLPSYDQQQDDKKSPFRGPNARFKNIKKGSGDYFGKK